MKTENLTLTNFNGRQFKVHTYFLADNPKLVEKVKPLIIVIPGGSFDHLSLREGEPVALAYASHGYNSVVMEYNLVQDPGKIYPDAGLDVLTTVKYFRDHAAEYQIDPHKIITIGFSAGGHVASSANYMANSEKYQSQFNYEAKNVRPDRTILGYPLINIEHIGFPIPDGEEKDMPDDPKLQDSALGVTRETPATFIFQAWDDPVVLISNSIEYLKTLHDNGVRCEVHLFTRGGHGFSLARPEVVEEGNAWQNNPHATHWFNLSLEWLQQELA
ncbi:MULTISPECIES: alpha/beta hydrolase [Lactobacillus]|uniref:Alpha/beta hydrolase n=1 Tax=Lactobacillus xujianguonis TaxID=2495899 RepID=A0A437SW45_9LACO|nr:MULTISPECIES: alpha/beta hydrolase [Lactobacillus]RVU71047.1 alpha/beta hydrolase [Lactobacillus xujianguonis]RVU76797.1 alpha/beta hydrolase [Lactobacillus xujianguonis]